MEGYRGSENRTSSDSTGLTGTESDEFSQQDSPVTESMSTEWTDEKHSLYLKSMEALFVNQLHTSMNLVGSCSQKDLSVPNVSYQLKSGTCTPSGQFKVLRRGSWQKVNFRRPESQSKPVNESHAFLASPWIQHFRSARKSQVAVCSALEESATYVSGEVNSGGKEVVFNGPASCSKHSHPGNSFSRHHDMIDADTEMSGQNFAEENITGEKAVSICSSKRKRVQKTGASSSDQVVPYGKSPVMKDVAEKCTSSPRELASIGEEQ